MTEDRQKRKEMVAALVVGQTVAVVGKRPSCFCWGEVVEQNGAKGVGVMIEGGMCSFDEYGVDTAYFWDEQQSRYQKPVPRFYWADNSDGKGGITAYDPNNPPADTSGGPWYIEEEQKALDKLRNRRSYSPPTGL
jgi:hypothetical protein